MLTDKSSLTFETKNSSTFLFQTIPRTTDPCFYKLFPQRLRKLHENGISRKTRTTKILNSLEQLQFSKTQSFFQPSFKDKNTKKSKISTYLTYKKQQRNFRQNRNKKLLLLKSKCLQSRCSLKHSLEDCNNTQYNSPVKQISPSKSKLNLITMDLHQTEVTQNEIQSKSREFYIKTSQGKKKKMKTLDYHNKIMSRLNESIQYERQNIEQLIEYSQPKLKITLAETLENSKPQSCNMLRRKFNIKNKANSLVCLNREVSVEFRPWTSNKSDRGQGNQ